MAVNDIRIQDNGGLNVLPTEIWQTEANATTIYPGEPVKQKSSGSPYAIPLADGEPVIGTIAVPVLGIAKSQSTHTASADGFVEVYKINPQVVLRAKAKSAAAADTQSEINALCGKQVVLDLTSSTYTVDTAAANGNTNGVVIVGGDPNGSFIDFKLRTSALQGPIA